MLYKTKTPLGSDGKPLKQSGQAITGYLQSLQLAYNANHELSKSVTITQQGLDLTELTTTYQYDAFGRRISKHTQTKHKTRQVNRSSAKIIKFPVQQQKTKQHQTHYLWDGNRQLQEQTDTHVFTTIYEQDSFEPIAQLIWVRDGLTAANDEPKTNDEGWYGNNKPVIKTGVQLYHYHNDHLGTPNELTDQQGDVVWFADYEAWGNTATVEWKSQRIDNIVVSEEHLQPIRFQGQHFDEETGLHYNRFRYFDPDMGMFTTRDPIGLMGGTNVFQYAPNPTGWIDPFGLAALWGKGKEHANFSDWFDNSSSSQVDAGMSNRTSANQIKGALRGKGGMHEKFPVSLAHVAKRLGFTSTELNSMVARTKDIVLTNVLDHDGNVLPDGAHHGSSAGRYFHIHLIADLRAAKNKSHAMDIVNQHHQNHMRTKC